MSLPLPCILDIEASGFGRRSYPIEVGYVLPDGRSRCTLIRPLPQWTHWDEQSEQLHGITRDALQAHGRPTDAVARMLNDDLAGLTVYCDGWAHDYTWLGALFDAAGQQPAFKLESVRMLLAESRLARLPELQREALQRMGVDRHRASNDARALQWAIEQAATA
jgi:hypothetical protein